MNFKVLKSFSSAHEAVNWLTQNRIEDTSIETTGTLKSTGMGQVPSGNYHVVLKAESNDYRAAREILSKNHGDIRSTRELISNAGSPEWKKTFEGLDPDEVSEAVNHHKNELMSEAETRSEEETSDAEISEFRYRQGNEDYSPRTVLEHQQDLDTPTDRMVNVKDGSERGTTEFEPQQEQPYGGTKPQERYDYMKESRVRDANNEGDSDAPDYYLASMITKAIMDVLKGTK